MSDEAIRVHVHRSERSPTFFVRIWRHRFLVWTLVRRQYQLRYRQSTAGIVWAFVTPLITMLAATLVFHRIAKVDTGAVPYPLFILAGLIPWSLFASGVTFSAPSVVSFGSMITRLSFPRAVIPVSMVGISLIDFAITALIFLAYAVLTRVGIPLAGAWCLPLLFIEVGLVLGVGFILSALTVFSRDIKILVPLLMQLWLFLTPVMYPLDAVPASLRPLYLINPMTGLVVAFRNALIYGRAPQFSLLLAAIVGAVATLLVGGWYFAATEKRFADVI